MTVSKTNFSQFYNRKITLLAFFSACLVFLIALLGSCKQEVDYFEYVSELRSNILLCEQDGFSLRVYAVEKEHPYSADGTKRDVSMHTEIYLSAPSGEKQYYLDFTVDGKQYYGDAVYDNVKAEYYFSCDANLSSSQNLPIVIEFDGNKVEINAVSVRSAAVLAPQDALKKLSTENAQLFSSLTDKYGFAGEIYIRLIYEDAAYYYFGIIEKSGKITAFLMNAESGKVLAKRES